MLTHGACLRLQRFVPCPLCCGFEARLPPPDGDRPAREVFLRRPADGGEQPQEEMSFNDLLEYFR